MKKRSTVALFLIMLIGLSLLLYPTLSNYLNSLHQSKAIAGYRETVETIDKEQYDRIWEQACSYNSKIDRLTISQLSDTERQEYYSQLDITGTGIMGYIEIPDIGVSLPIYHGTAERVLQMAVGHLEGSSLPVGGEGSHCVVSGHRGLPSAKLFTDLDQLKEGNVFILTVLDEQLTYQVDQISVVEAEQLCQIEFVEDQDYCTLVTCTPYGVNSHRLLVRGRRVPNGSVEVKRVTADGTEIHRGWATAIYCLPLLLLLLMGRMIYRKLRK